METLTIFIDGLFNEELGQEEFQVFSSKSLNSCSYKEVVISGSSISDCIFENCIFENCTFWASRLDNNIFINCLFINCKFQFTEFTNCNFESTDFDNCIWGLSKLHDEDTLTKSNISRNLSFESRIPDNATRSLNLFEALLTA